MGSAAADRAISAPHEPVQCAAQRNWTASFAQPRLRSLSYLPGRQSELATERPHEGGIAAEAKINREIEQPNVLPFGGDQSPHREIQSLIPHIARETVLGFEHSIERRSRNAEPV